MTKRLAWLRCNCWGVSPTLTRRVWHHGTRQKTHQAQPQVHGRRSSQETDCGGNSGGQEIRMTRSESWIKQHAVQYTETSLRSNWCNSSTCTGSWAKRGRVVLYWFYSKLYEFVSAVATQPILVFWIKHLLGCYSTQGKCGTSSSIAGISEK